jgi:N-acetylglucosaminyl-diphospho-decaprenol L-rhamnosyltransferase
VSPVDVVIVSYNSRDELRGCIEPLAGLDGVNVIVVDNASADRGLEVVEDLEIDAVPLDQNGGFAHGCNVGWRRGSAPYVLFLNPDAHIDEEAIERLVTVLERDASIGAAAPLIRHTDGSLDFSQRRFPRLRSTYAQALFLHRLFPRADWTDEVIRAEEAYTRSHSADWVSGACILVRREALEGLGGWDEGFFMYCEDTDLCRRLWSSGLEVRFEPQAVVTHEGGASAPRASLLPVLAASRLRYATKHRTRPSAFLERVGIGLGALTHVAVGRGGKAARAGHARALRLAITGHAQS